MGLFMPLKKNEGMLIERKNEFIEVIARKIEGTRTAREADLEIRGDPGKSVIHLKHDNGLVKILPDVYIGIRNKKRADKYEVEMHFSTNYYMVKLKYD